MKLSDLIKQDVILDDLEAPDAETTIRTMIAALVKAGRIPAEMEPKCLDIVLERERSMSTGIGHGVAIPHGTVPGLEGVVGALGRAGAGIDFRAIDKGAVHLVVLVLVGETAYRQHIRTLAIVSRLMNSAALRRHLLEAPGATEMVRLIRAEESDELRSHHRSL